MTTLAYWGLDVYNGDEPITHFTHTIYCYGEASAGATTLLNDMVPAKNSPVWKDTPGLFWGTWSKTGIITSNQNFWE